MAFRVLSWPLKTMLMILKMILMLMKMRMMKMAELVLKEEEVFSAGLVEAVEI